MFSNDCFIKAARCFIVLIFIANTSWSSDFLSGCRANPQLVSSTAFTNSPTAKSNPQLVFSEWRFDSCRSNYFTGYEIAPRTAQSNLKPTTSAAILYVHWFDPREADSNPQEFMNEAIDMANKGVRVLLVTTLWTEPNADYHKRQWQDDLQTTKAQTQDLINALKFLTERPNVDKNRVGYIGHDYGGVFGSLVVNNTQLVSAAVLITVVPRFSDWYLYGSASGTPEGA